MSEYDVIVIGGGFYGCMVALHYCKTFKNVLIIEQESSVMLKASVNNQARIHNGYHYPRSLLTAKRSHANYNKFKADFKEAVYSDFLMTYAIAKGSKTTPEQFVSFCKQIPIPLTSYPINNGLLNPSLIEEAFTVKEEVFSAAKVRYELQMKLFNNNVKTLFNTTVVKVLEGKNCINVRFVKDNLTGILKAKKVINCTYAGINKILGNSNLALLNVKTEYTEMPYVKLPKLLKDKGITIMDGAYLAVMPFPDLGVHTIHHVTLTPSSTPNASSQHQAIIKDATRYIPLLKQAEYVGSMYETKIVVEDETTDARPIVYKKDYGIKGFDVVLGAKIDTVYDLLDKLSTNALGLNIIG